MTVENEIRVRGMHKKSRMDLGCPIINVDSESLVSGVNKKSEFSRVELGCAIMTEQSLWNTKNSRIEPG